jgi:hypothetical protein
MKMDILAICVCKTNAKVVDTALAKLFPPKPEKTMYATQVLMTR